MEFNKLVKAIVEPTLYSFSFFPKEEVDGLLTYANDTMIISLSYDYNRSFEVDVTFTLKSNGKSFSYSLVKAYFVREVFNLIATQLTNTHELRNWLEGVEIFLRKNLGAMVALNEEVCDQLEKVQNRLAQDFEKEKQGRIIRERVDEYWGERDYYGLVEFLKSSSGEYEDSIKKKYEYALKMLQKDSFQRKAAKK